MMRFSKNRHVLVFLVLCSLGGVWAQLKTSFSNHFSLATDNRGVYDWVNWTAATFCDFNNDGFVDLATTCDRDDWHLKIWKNDPTNPGNFSLFAWGDNSIPGLLVYTRQLAWADAENDGDMDLMVLLKEPFPSKVVEHFLWLNSGPPNYTFSLAGGASNTVIEGVENPQGAGFLDVNRDGNLDIFLSDGGDATGGKGDNRILQAKDLSDSDPTNWYLAHHHTDTKTPQWVSGYVDAAGTFFGTGWDCFNGNGAYSAIADLNNDGRQDIIYNIDYQPDASRGLIVWINLTAKGSNVFSFYEVSALFTTNRNPQDGDGNDPFQYSSVVAFDAENDGDLDLFHTTANGKTGIAEVDGFYQNNLGYGAVAYSAGALNNQLVLRTDLPFGNLNPTFAGGSAVGDLDNNGFQDLVVSYMGGTGDGYFLHTGVLPQGGGSYAKLTGTPNLAAGEAKGVAFADIDNDGDLDVFRCLPESNTNFIINNTNSNNKPLYEHDGTRNDPTPGFGWGTALRAKHYLRVMFSLPSKKLSAAIGTRIYVYRYVDETPSSYGKDELVGMRELDGGSGYGSQSSQVAHFGLNEELLGADPHKKEYAVKSISATGEESWRYKVVPDECYMEIEWKDGAGNKKTTKLDQTLEFGKNQPKIWIVK